MSHESVIIGFEQWNEYQSLIKEKQKQEDRSPQIEFQHHYYYNGVKNFQEVFVFHFNIPEEINFMLSEYRKEELFRQREKIKNLEHELEKYKKLKKKGWFKFHFSGDMI